MKVTIIVPTYNEKDNIERLVRTIFNVVKKVENHQVNILIVDDNSPDGTQDIVKSLQKEFKQLFLITGKKEGLGKAYLRGMKYADEQLGSEVMFEMDADFSHDPKRIPAFLKAVDGGADMVVGSRYIAGGSIPANWGIHRKIFSISANILIRLALLNPSHHDWTTGYRAIRTPIYHKVRKELEDFTGYTFQVSFLHKALLQGANVVEVPIQFIDRVYGNSKIGSEYIFNLLNYLILTNVKHPPRQVKFLVVGTLGFLTQALLYGLIKTVIPAEPANVVSALAAITVNFTLNNFWTFHDRKHTLSPIIVWHFVKFVVLSSGSIVIQTITIAIFRRMMGATNLADWLGFVIGVLLGLFWNYTMYSKVIWKHSKK